MSKIKIFFLNLNKSSGITLVELIVTISIMAIIVIPFIATSVSSSKNNSFADDKINSFNTVNRIMEDMSSMPDFLHEESEYFSGVGENIFKDYNGENTNGFLIKYRINKVSVGQIPENEEGKENSYSSFTDDNNNTVIKDVEIKIENDKFYIGNSFYNLLPEYYHLKIGKVSEQYHYTLYNSLNVFLLDKNFNSSGSEVSFSINIDDNTTDFLKLYIDVNESMDKKVNIFLIGENTDKRINLINEGEIPFLTYNNIDDSPINEYNNILYKVDVYAEIDGKESDRMVSYVKK